MFFHIDVCIACSMHAHLLFMYSYVYMLIVFPRTLMDILLALRTRFFSFSLGARLTRHGAYVRRRIGRTTSLSMQKTQPFRSEREIFQGVFGVE